MRVWEGRRAAAEAGESTVCCSRAKSQNRGYAESPWATHAEESATRISSRAGFESAFVSFYRPGNGGGFHLTGAGEVSVTKSWVTDNFADNEGGGLWNSAAGMMTVKRTTIEDNSSPTGPDVFNDGGTFTVDGNDVPVGP